MYCPMCLSEDCKVTQSVNSGTLFYCRSCGYSRAHNNNNIYMELWLDFVEFNNKKGVDVTINSLEELSKLQKSVLS
jgi:DNA-directed RNA polymerase subunit M/transcription elongation factor TFIIS